MANGIAWRPQRTARCASSFSMPRACSARPGRTRAKRAPGVRPVSILMGSRRREMRENVSHTWALSVLGIFQNAGRMMTRKIALGVAVLLCGLHLRHWWNGARGISGGRRKAYSGVILAVRITLPRFSVVSDNLAEAGGRARSGG